MKSRICLALTMGLAAAAAANAAGAATAKDAKVAAVAGGEFTQLTGGVGAQQIFDVAHASWQSPLNPSPLSVAVNPTSNTNGTESYGSSSTATWQSATMGNFTAIHSAHTTLGAGEERSVAFFHGGGQQIDFGYTFQATGDGLLEMNYDVSVDGQPEDELGAWRVGLVEADNPDDVTFRDTNPLTDPFGSLHHNFGFANFTLMAGKTYTFALLADEGSVDPDRDLTLNFKETASFDWKIVENATAVPEPSTWALMIAGFGLMGASLRRRHSGPRTA